jgi:hypothetical protein
MNVDIDIALIILFPVQLLIVAVHKYFCLYTLVKLSFFSFLHALSGNTIIAIDAGLSFYTNMEMI